MTDPAPLRALVVFESLFGNTRAIAEEVASGLSDAGLEVTCTEVVAAPPADRVDADLLVVGAPTHAFSLSRAASREEAVRRGADPDHARTGIREWLDGLATSGQHPLAAVFDTRIRGVRRLPASAAVTARRILHRHGILLVDQPVGFVVSDQAGPLLEGELERARAWGRRTGVVTRIRVNGRAGSRGWPF